MSGKRGRKEEGRKKQAGGKDDTRALTEVAGPNLDGSRRVVDRPCDCSRQSVSVVPLMVEPPFLARLRRPSVGCESFTHRSSPRAIVGRGANLSLICNPNAFLGCARSFAGKTTPGCPCSRGDDDTLWPRVLLILCPPSPSIFIVVLLYLVEQKKSNANPFARRALQILFGDVGDCWQFEGNASQPFPTSLGRVPWAGKLRWMPHGCQRRSPLPTTSLFSTSEGGPRKRDRHTVRTEEEENEESESVEAKARQPRIDTILLRFSRSHRGLVGKQAERKISHGGIAQPWWLQHLVWFAVSKTRTTTCGVAKAPDGRNGAQGRQHAMTSVV